MSKKKKEINKDKFVKSINKNVRSSVRKLNPILKGIVGKAVKEDRRKIWTEWIYYLNRIHTLDISDLKLRELFFQLDYI